MTKQARRSRHQHDRLARRYQQLKARVAELDAHRYLTAEEALEVASLKRQKLAAKDALARLSGPATGRRPPRDR